MGLDLYLEAKITEKATGRCITAAAPESPPDPDDFDPEAGRFRCPVHWMCGSGAYPVRDDWIDIINRHQKSAYDYDETLIPLPQTALREMCSCLYSYLCVPESNRFEWDTKCGFWNIRQREQETAAPYRTEQIFDSIGWDLRHSEYQYRFWADALHDFIGLIEQIFFENKYTPLPADDFGIRSDGKMTFPDDFIPAEADRVKFRENPQGYEWTFRLFNSF